MDHFRNLYYKKKEKLQNFVPHLKLGRVKQAPRTRFRQALRSSIAFGQLIAEQDFDQDIQIV